MLLSFAWFFAGFSLALLAKVLLMKKACILSTRMKNNFMSHISSGNIWNIQRSYWGSSCSLMFFKIGAKFRKIHRKHLRWSLFLIKLQTLFITDAVAVWGYFKNNLQLILYGVEIRSCQCLFNLIQQFYVQNQKYKFEKRKRDICSNILVNIPKRLWITSFTCL